MISVTQGVPCLVCQHRLDLRIVRGRKSGKPFVMLLCSRDGRHFRAFVNDQAYVHRLVARLEGQTPVSQTKADQDDGVTPSRRSITILERAS